MMGIIMPETCWTVSVRQSYKILRLIVASGWMFYLSDFSVKMSFIHFESNHSSTSNGGGHRHNKVYDTCNTTAPLTAMQNYFEIWFDFAVGMWKLVKYRTQWQYGLTMNVWATEDFRTGEITLRMNDECSRWCAFLVLIDDKLWS